VLWGQPFALAEQFNRRSTFIASYRTAKEQGMATRRLSPARRCWKRSSSIPRQQAQVGARCGRRHAVHLQDLLVSYLELMQRMWNQGGPEGKRAVGWALAMLLLMSGAGGVPFMEDAEDLIDGAGQMMGYNISAKQWRKELLANVVGKELGEFMEQGLSGLPGAPIDVSGRLGMGNLLPGTGLFLDKPNRERDLMEIVGLLVIWWRAASPVRARCWEAMLLARRWNRPRRCATWPRVPTWQPPACTATPRATR
jgi:hypothetical protein